MSLSYNLYIIDIFNTKDLRYVNNSQLFISGMPINVINMPILHVNYSQL